MQILFSTSDEAENLPGLNIFDDKILKINLENRNHKCIKKLNVGWRKINFDKKKFFIKYFHMTTIIFISCMVFFRKKTESI